MANKYIENKENNQDVKKLDSKELLLQIMQQEYPNDPVVEQLKEKIITNLKPVIKQIIQE